MTIKYLKRPDEITCKRWTWRIDEFGATSIVFMGRACIVQDYKNNQWSKDQYRCDL